MNDEVGEVRIRAARALGIIRGQPSVRPLVRALADPSRWSAIRVAAILINVGAEAVDEVLAAYEDLPHRARLSALDILGRIRSLRASPLMRRSLSDPHPDIRSRAAHAMGLIGDPTQTDELIRALADPEWPVRAMAAKALGRLGASRAIPGLCEAMKDGQWWVRANAGEALRHLGPEGRDALIGMLDADDTYARHQALAQLEEGRILDEIVADLGARERIRREAALHCVQKIIAMERVDHLSQQALENTQESVRRTLSGVLNGADRLGS
jgi:HEAT repeat protein